jgi:post-segregation antitoxin (ccd killing protein)
MTDKRAGARRPVNLSLSAHTVAEAREWTDNLSAEVERLLREFIEQQRRQRQTEAEALRRSASLWAAYAQRQGSFADEYSTL